MNRRVRRVAASASVVGVLAVAGCVQLPAGPSGPGTRGEPIGVGVAAPVGSWELAFGPTVGDADALVAAHDPANKPPPAGRRYVLVPLRLTFKGSDVGEPWLDLDVRYLSRAGVLYGEAEIDQCGSVPGSLEYVAEMPPGTTRWGNLCVAVPADEVDGGTWVARNGGFWGWNGFFAASTTEPTGAGTRANPTPVGTQAGVGDYMVSAGTTDPDALGAIRDWDGEAAPPASGRRYVMAPLKVTFKGGASSGEPWSDLAVTWVAADGTVFGPAEADSCGDIPDGLEGVGVQQAGRPVTGNVCVSVPLDAVAGGRRHVTAEGTAMVWQGYFAGA